MSLGSKPLVHVLLSHQILLTKHRFEDKMTKSFKIETTELEIPSAGSF